MISGLKKKSEKQESMRVGKCEFGLGLSHGVAYPFPPRLKHSVLQDVFLKQENNQFKIAS